MHDGSAGEVLQRRDGLQSLCEDTAPHASSQRAGAFSRKSKPCCRKLPRAAGRARCLRGRREPANACSRLPAHGAQPRTCLLVTSIGISESNSVGVDRLRDVVRGSRRDRFLAVALHRLHHQEMIGARWKGVLKRMAPHRLVAVHARHRRSAVEHEIDLWMPMQELDAVLPVLGVGALAGAVGLGAAGEGEDIPHVVVDDEDLPLLGTSSAGVQLLQRPCASPLAASLDADRGRRRRSRPAADAPVDWRT